MPRRRTIIVVLTIVALVAQGIKYVIRQMYPDPYAMTDVTEYSSLLTHWKSTGLVDHFPAAIPPSAQFVRLSAFPGAMQASPWIQLRLRLPPAEVAAIETSAEGVAGKIYPGGGGEFDHYSADRKHEWPTARFHTADNPRTQWDFPDSYTFYVIKAVDRGFGSWDPYDGCGIAISRATNEVVYWATQ